MLRTPKFPLISFAHLVFDFEMGHMWAHKNIGMCKNRGNFLNERGTIPYPPKNKGCHLSMPFIGRNKHFCLSTTNFTLISFAHLLFDFEMELHGVHKKIGMCKNGWNFSCHRFFKNKKKLCKHFPSTKQHKCYKSHPNQRWLRLHKCTIKINPFIISRHL